MKIGITIIATNAYFPLGIRFIKKFKHYYKGDFEIIFFFFSDKNPLDFTNTDGVIWIKQNHNSWLEATNSKFNNILSIKDNVDYLYYFDADTNINSDFTEQWFLGDIVGGEHFGNNDWMKNEKPYDRNPKSMCYIPKDTKLKQTYYYGAFFGGKYDKVIDFCTILKNNQQIDKKNNYEPGVNDESYINHYFHYNPPSKIKTKDFKFIVSDKGGIEKTREVSLDVTNLNQKIKENKNKLFEITNGELIVISN